jgi:3-oxoacyl-[acyl-carrier protein] reductase
MKLLENKTAMITGAGRGIGRGSAQTLAKHGCSIAFTFNTNIEADKILVNELTTIGVKVKAYKSDAADFDAANKLVEDVVSDFDSLDILVNNAGITKDNLLMRMGEEDFDEVINVNLKSVFNMTKAVQRIFLKQKNGSLIHMSSVVGVKGNAGQANYAASKAGIIGFSKSIALEIGSRNIRSNVIAPGFIETEMTARLPEEIVHGWRDGIPLKRGGKPEDVANACVFLASELSSYVTGQVLHVDGGMLT